MLIVRVTFYLSLLASFGAKSLAGDLRCNGTIINKGMRSSEVELRCGKPALTHSEQRVIREVDPNQNEKDIFQNIESWLIEQSGSNIRVVEFVDDRVDNVRDIQLRSESENDRYSKCNSTNLKGIHEAVLVKYYCGTPMSTAVVSDEFKDVRSFNNHGKIAKRRIRTEHWDFKSNESKFRVTISDGSVTGISAM